MPLDDREQRILEEIEAQFYQEDPSFAQTVRDTALDSPGHRYLRWAIAGLVAGLILMLVFFTRNLYVAFVGFLLMVGSVAWIVTVMNRRGGERVAWGGWLTRVRHRWQRSR